jgi:hypothetical protein
MVTLRSSAEFYRRQQRLSVVTITAARRAWRRLDRDALDATRGEYRRTLLPVLMAAQGNAAEAGAAYVGAALAEQNIDVDPAGEVVPGALVGRAADGRSLSDLLDVPVIRVKQRIAEGMPPHLAMGSGRSLLDSIAQGTVSDAGRQASGVGIAARPTIGYARMLNPPSCGRCAILAGKWFRSNTGFQRHPRCDCTHIPSRENVAGDLRTDPRRYFDSLDPAEQDRLFGKHNAQAIRDGADPIPVMNAALRGGGVTTVGIGGRRVRLVKPTPEQIYDMARGRSETVRLLTLHGYIR